MATIDVDPRATGRDTEALGRLLDGRWSCRGFEDKAVPRSVIERVLDLARRSPLWCNTQPWHATVTEGAGTERFRSALSTHAPSTPPSPDFPFPSHYRGAYDERRKETAWRLYDSVGIELGDREASAEQTGKNFSFFGAPHVAMVTTEADLGVYGVLDCGLYVQTFLLAAQSVGLGAIPQAALAAHSPFVREFFALPENRLVVYGISFGWPDKDHPANNFRTDRAEVDSTVTWVD